MADRDLRRRSEPEPRGTKNETARRSSRRSSGVPRRTRGRIVLIRLLAMLLIVAAVILGVAIFFRVTELQVRGNALYTAEEVIEASGVKQGDNLMSLNKSVTAGKIQAVLPYIEKVWIDRILPDTVVINVVESDAAYLVEDLLGGGWLISSAGKILEQASASAADYPRLTGVMARAPEPGAMIVSEQPECLEAAKLLLVELEKTDYLSRIVEIDVSKTYDIILWYENRYEVHLGGSDELAYKIQYLTDILARPELAGQNGVIDLTLEEDRSASFRPWQDSLN